MTTATLRWIQSLLTNAEMVEIKEMIAACRDPTDDKFLELAVIGRADFIISGDRSACSQSLPVNSDLTPAIFMEASFR